MGELKKKKIKKDEKKILTKEELSELPLNQRYVLRQLKSEYNKKRYIIVTPGVVNRYTKEDYIVLAFNSQDLLGCCGSTIIGDMKYHQYNLIEDKKEDKEFIMNIMLNSQNTNNIVLTDSINIDNNAILDLIKLVQPELKPVDSYFNENSGNMVVIYSYNKSK